MEADGTYPAVPAESVLRNGTTGQRVTADPAEKSYAGYVFDEDSESNLLSGVVGAAFDTSGNTIGTLTLRVYYRRNTRNVYLDKPAGYELTDAEVSTESSSNENTWDDEPGNVSDYWKPGRRQGDTVTLPTVKDMPTGYELIWSVPLADGTHSYRWDGTDWTHILPDGTQDPAASFAFIMPDRDVNKITGRVAPRTDTPYKVIRHVDTNGDGNYTDATPDYVRTEDRRGTTDDDARLTGSDLTFTGYDLALARTLEGFTNGSLNVTGTTPESAITDGTYTKAAGTKSEQRIVVSGGQITSVTGKINAESTQEIHLYYKKKQQGEEDNYGAGKIITEVDIEPGAPVDTVEGLNVDLAKDELTEEELDTEVFVDGDTAKIWLEIVPKDPGDIPDEDRIRLRDAASLIDAENATRDGKPAGVIYMDISLHKRLIDSAGNIMPQKNDIHLNYFGDNAESDDPNAPHAGTYDQRTVRVTVVVPKDIVAQAVAPGHRREYAVFRIHEYHGVGLDGKPAGKLAEKLAGWTTDTTLVFDTGLFCTYALVWRDVVIPPATPATPTPGGGGGGGSTPDTSTPPAGGGTDTRVTPASQNAMSLRGAGSYNTDVNARTGKTGESRDLMRRYWILCIAMFLLLILTAGECREYRRR